MIQSERFKIFYDSAKVVLYKQNLSPYFQMIPACKQTLKYSNITFYVFSNYSLTFSGFSP